MKKREDRKIDKLFKEGLNHSNEIFNEDHWNELEKIMDRQKRRYWLRITGLVLLTGAIVLPLFYWMESTLNSPATEYTKQKSGVTIKTPTQNTLPARASEKKQSDFNVNTEVDYKSIEKTYSKEKHPQMVAKPTQIPPKQREFVSDSSPNRSEPIQLKKNMGSIKVEAIKLIPSQEVNNGFIVDKQDTTLDISSVSKPPNQEKAPGFIKTDSIWTESKIDSVSDGNTNQKKIHPGWLTVLVAPDLTSIRGAGQVRLSQNFGVLYSYPIGKKLSISTGVMYARKRYASPYRYYKPENPPILSEYPKEVNAICHVIDVPLLLNLNLLDNQKIRINIGAGISSYFMLKEKYRFTYEGTGGYGKKEGTYEIDGKNQHFLGIADLSVSIERKLSERITLGVRPFAKVPFTGIGYGQIKLESKGIAVTLGLDLSKKTSSEK